MVSRRSAILAQGSSGGIQSRLSGFHRVVTDDEIAAEIMNAVAALSKGVLMIHRCLFQHKICHRDLKLENILLDEYGNAKVNTMTRDLGCCTYASCGKSARCPVTCRVLFPQYYVSLPVMGG